MIPVQYETQKVTLPLVVVKGSRPALMGWNWLKELHLNWKEIFTVHRVPSQSKWTPGVNQVLQRHKAVFSESQGCIEGFKAKIHIKTGPTPILCKARPVPYALREAAVRELDRLEKMKVIFKTEKSVRVGVSNCHCAKNR